MAPSNTRSERIASRNGVSRRVGLIRLCYRARCGMREMTYRACGPRCRNRREGTQHLSCPRRYGHVVSPRLGNENPVVAQAIPLCGETDDRLVTRLQRHDRQTDSWAHKILPQQAGSTRHQLVGQLRRRVAPTVTSICSGHRVVRRTSAKGWKRIPQMPSAIRSETFLC